MKKQEEGRWGAAHPWARPSRRRGLAGRQIWWAGAWRGWQPTQLTSMVNAWLDRRAPRSLLLLLFLKTSTRARQGIEQQEEGRGSAGGLAGGALEAGTRPKTRDRVGSVGDGHERSRAAAGAARPWRGEKFRQEAGQRFWWPEEAGALRCSCRGGRGTWRDSGRSW